MNGNDRKENEMDREARAEQISQRIANDVARAQREVAAAREALAEAEATLNAATAERREFHEQSRRDAIDARGYEAFVDPNPGPRGVADYILPLGREYSKTNVLDPDSYDFGRDWIAGGYAFVMQKPERTRPTRIFASPGGYLGDDWRIGNVWDCRHDQTGGRLGTYTVVGIVEYDQDGNVRNAVGETPTTKMAVAVFK